MLDLFTIFSKGGIVLWCFQGTSQLFTPSVNALIKSVILQERGGNNTFNHDALTLKYKLDNEFELVFVVAYQKILQLSYVDKFLDAIQMEFRNKYKDDLRQGKISRSFEFTDTYQGVLRDVETQDKVESKQVKQMRSFEQSQKSKKTVSSMIESKKEETGGKGGKNKKKENKAAKAEVETTPVKPAAAPVACATPPGTPSHGGELDEETLMRNREKFLQRGKKAKTPQQALNKKTKTTPEPKKGKQARVWENGGTSRDTKNLDYNPSDSSMNGHGDGPGVGPTTQEREWVGQMKGGLRDMDPDSSTDEEEDEDEEEEETAAPANKAGTKKSGGGGFGFLSGLRNLVSSKALTRTDIEPALAKMKDHLIVKNVAADIADKLCESVATQLEGKVLGTFSSVASTVRQLLEAACIQVLAPKRRLDILRDAMEAKAQGNTYNICFCGVNGVGKSTNLAKVAFWLVENGLRVQIAACDTFRAGAVEQLRTHEKKLNSLHPASAHGGRPMVELYEKGYGKDAAGIAMEAISAARHKKFDVVLIDTAGRMQDNEPLMRALAKLVKVNQPDLVLFVGEALVGNEAIDQLTKFNQALADHSQMENPRLIDGILLTKFDTIDDKVGAAISMTYITGQPIVFVGTGQTYTDLKNLNSKAVVNALLKA